MRRLLMRVPPGFACTRSAETASQQYSGDEMETYVLIGGVFGLGLLIAVFGLWKLR